MGLHRILYCSRATAATADDIQAISESCEKNNPSNHITGALLHENGYFLQLLEGPRPETSRTFATIACDPRHTEVELVQAGPVEVRLFAEFAMYPAPATRALARYLVRGAFEPFEMDWRSIEAMLLEVSTHAAARRLAVA